MTFRLFIGIFASIALLGTLAFILLYACRTKSWWSTPMGKHMMAISVVNAMLLGVALAATIGRNYPGRRIITATTMASFATVLWWRVGMLLRAQKRDREDSQREVNNG